jgi:ketosteroid isomerase-like protein
MSQENVEIVRALIEAVNGGDLDAALKDAAPNLELDLSRAFNPDFSGVVSERGQAERVLREFRQGWEVMRIEPNEFIEVGDHVVVPWTAHMVGREGIEVVSRVTWTFTIRGGVIQGLCMYQEREEALEAVGLSE